MITYKIVFKNTNKGKKQPLDPKAPDFQEEVFKRSLQSCPFKEGQRVKIRGTSVIGTITEIYKDIKDVQWQANKPMYVEIEVNGELKLANPGQLRHRKQ